MSGDLQNKNRNKKINKSALVLLAIVILSSVLVYGTYKILLERFYLAVLVAYMVIETVFILAYLIYNRGFSRKGVTREMLPAEWSEDKKDEFIHSGEERLKSSRWMLVVILAFLFTFFIEIIELYFLPFLFGLF
ncbi:MAG: hypothetical protein IIV11_04150 [Clostridia bacterium]|nr:hypothetical protein [Clostridia bacterium]